MRLGGGEGGEGGGEEDIILFYGPTVYNILPSPLGSTDIKS